MSAPFLPFARPDIGDAEIAAVTEAMRSGWVTTGPKARLFEQAFVDYLKGEQIDCQIQPLPQESLFWLSAFKMPSKPVKNLPILSLILTITNTYKLRGSMVIPILSSTMAPLLYSFLPNLSQAQAQLLLSSSASVY